MDKKCICDTDITLTKKCKVCNIVEDIKLSKEEIRDDRCPVHLQMTICGKPYYVCKKCVDEGWINTHGDGGCGHNYNIYTEEVRYY